MLLCSRLYQCEIYEEYTASIFKVKMKMQVMQYVPPKYCYPPTRIHGVNYPFLHKMNLHTMKTQNVNSEALSLIIQFSQQPL
jgi:hypothetical protein